MTVTDQARAFLAMALCGALLGAVYDALGALRRGRLLTAAADLLFGVLAAVLAALITPFMPLLLAFAAGTMIYVVIQELLPEARVCQDDKTATLGFIAGFLVMMILDVSLG